MLEIFIDADGCPVKEEIYKVARRYRLKVFVVANARLQVPREADIEQVVVAGGLDLADDWIAEHAGRGDIVISADLPLAARCLEKGARVIGQRGQELTEDSIGSALAGRALQAHLRELGTITGGPRPFDKKDRSRFLQRLDQTIQAVRRAHPGGA